MRDFIDKSVIDAFIKSDSGKILKQQLTGLEKGGSILSNQKEEIIAIKADEYSRFFNNPKNAFNCVKIFLKEFPELFNVVDVITAKEPIEKFYFVINSNSSYEFEKILRYKNVDYMKVDKKLDGKPISFYIGYLKNPNNYALEEKSYRQVWKFAEDAGIRLGHFTYPQWKGAYYSLFLFRSFPVVSDSYGDNSRAAGGLREDLGLAFKSSWEANVARILNYKSVKWKYEVLNHGFLVETGYYIPDFTVYQESKSRTIIEVKGLWDMQSVKKMCSFRNNYPDEKLIIIDQDFYSLLEEKFKLTIENWESTNSLPRKQHILPVIGIHIANRLKTIQTLKEKDILILKREPDNPYDPNALKVLTTDEREVGYIAKEWAAIFSLKIDSGIGYEVSLYKKHLDSKRVDIKLLMVSNISVLNNIGF